jgi:hypothetical protein
VYTISSTLIQCFPPSWPFSLVISSGCGSGSSRPVLPWTLASSWSILLSTAVNRVSSAEAVCSPLCDLSETGTTAVTAPNLPCKFVKSLWVQIPIISHVSRWSGFLVFLPLPDQTRMLAEGQDPRLSVSAYGSLRPCRVDKTRRRQLAVQFGSWPTSRPAKPYSYIISAASYVVRQVHRISME